MTEENWIREQIKLSKTPLDVEKLIADGVIREVKGNWYEILDRNRFPQHANVQRIDGNPPRVKLRRRKKLGP